MICASPVCRITVYILGANLLETLFVLSFDHQNPQSGLIALTLPRGAGRDGSWPRAAQVASHVGHDRGGENRNREGKGEAHLGGVDGKDATGSARRGEAQQLDGRTAPARMWRWRTWLRGCGEREPG
jgi:hypothetical protein